MRIKKCETALAVGLLVAIIACAFPMSTQAGISDKMTRLHILANSDSAQDQELKLAVRDAVLSEIGPEDQDISDRLLQRLGQVAQKTVADAGFDYKITISRQRMYFDTRRYEGFSLPAGYYDAVRILIGDGAGKNWWCVMFPPLCAGVCEEDIDEIARQAGLSEDEISFIRGDGTVYVLRFKLAELVGRLVGWFS